MTVSLNTAPPAKPASAEAAAPAPGKDAKFGDLIDSADVNNVPIDVPAETPAAQQAEPADRSLEALLSALKLTLLPGTALPKTASKSGKAATKDKPANDGKQEGPAAELLAGLSVSSLPAPVAARDMVYQARQAVDDVLAKSATQAAPIGLGDAAPALLPLPLAIDLATLADVTAIKSIGQPPPVTAQLDRLIDTARDAAWLDRLSQDIALSASSADRMSFRMMPPNLGALDVTVERQAAGLSVNMTTHTADARNLIAESRQQMIDSLKAQGVPLIQLSLQTAGEEQAGHRPPTFFNHLIEAAPISGTELAAQPVESTTAERVGRFA